MATWTTIPNASLAPGAPARSIDAIALRDNPVAIAEGATGAPIVQSKALANYIEKNAAYTALENDFIYCDTLAIGAFTVTLPAAPADNQRVTILDHKSNFATANLTIARNGKLIMGLAEDMIIDRDNAIVELIFFNNDWRMI